MNKVYLLGGAQTDFSRNWSKEGKNFVALLKEAIGDALKNCQLGFEDIASLNQENKVACFIGNFIAEQYVNQGHLGAFLTEVHSAFYGVPSSRYEAACASSSVAIDAAMTKIMCGDYDLAVVVGWELMKSVDSKRCADILGRAAYYEKESKSLDYPFPSLFGRVVDEIQKKYKTEEKRLMDALAEIAVINYSNAKRNPAAQTRHWFMDRTQAQSRGTATNPYVGGRLASSDCSQVTDGAAVVLLASESFVKKRGYGKKPFIKGYGNRTAPLRFDAKISESSDSPYLLKWTRQAVCDAYRRSGLTANDIDVFELHDCFTSSEYTALSCVGIAAPGREYEAIESGLISFDGKKPVNPSGGLIGCGHPVGATGARMLLDLYKQMSGEAGGYQVSGASNGLMLNIGGTATTNYAFIVGV